jgi:hypothetical protein
MKYSTLNQYAQGKNMLVGCISPMYHQIEHQLKQTYQKAFKNQIDAVNIQQIQNMIINIHINVTSELGISF